MYDAAQICTLCRRLTHMYATAMLCSLLAAGQGIRRAIILVASQKTLPIAVTVLNGLANLLKGPIGLAVIPCVTAHLSQILVDSLLVSFWRRSDQRTVGGSDMPTQEFITKVTRNY